MIAIPNELGSGAIIRLLDAALMALENEADWARLTRKMLKSSPLKSFAVLKKSVMPWDVWTLLESRSRCNSAPVDEITSLTFTVPAALESHN